MGPLTLSLNLYSLTLRRTIIELKKVLSSQTLQSTEMKIILKLSFLIIYFFAGCKSNQNSQMIDDSFEILESYFINKAGGDSGTKIKEYTIVLKNPGDVPNFEYLWADGSKIKISVRNDEKRIVLKGNKMISDDHFPARVESPIKMKGEGVISYISNNTTRYLEIPDFKKSTQ